MNPGARAMFIHESIVTYVSRVFRRGLNIRSHFEIEITKRDCWMPLLHCDSAKLQHFLLYFCYFNYIPVFFIIKTKIPLNICQAASLSSCVAPRTGHPSHRARSPHPGDTAPVILPQPPSVRRSGPVTLRRPRITRHRLALRRHPATAWRHRRSTHTQVWVMTSSSVLSQDSFALYDFIF